MFDRLTFKKGRSPLFEVEDFIRKRLRHLSLEAPFATTFLPTVMTIDDWTSQLLLISNGTSLLVKNLDTPHIEQSVEIDQPLNDVAWYPFDSGLFATSLTQTVKLWDSSRCTVIKSFHLNSVCNQLGFSSVASSKVAQGIVAVGTGHGEIRLINLLSGSAAHTLSTGDNTDILSICWSPREGHILASGGTDSRILIWDIRKPNSCLYSLDEYNQESSEPKESSSSSSSTTKRARYVAYSNKPSNPQACAHNNAAITSLKFIDGGRHLVSRGSDGSLKLWKESRHFHYYKNTQVSFKNVGVRSRLCYSSEGNLIFQPSRQQSWNIDCIDAFTGEVVKSLNGHVQRIRSLAYRENAQELYSAGQDGFILKWSCKEKNSKQEDEEDYWSD